MQTAKIYEKTQILIEAIFRRFKTFWSKAEQDTAPKKKRTYEDDMAIPRANYRSQYGGYNPSWLRGAILILTLGFIFFFQGCRTQEIPVESITEVRYVDSVVLKDSVVVIPTERIVDIVPWYDTLRMATSISESKAWVDTANHTIKGELKNKQGKLVEIKYVDRVVKRDSIVEKEVPVYVKGDTVERIKRPWWAWVCLTWTVVTLCSISFVIFKKIKGLI